jgi:hypothetical protein
LRFLCRCSRPFPRNSHFPARPIPFNEAGREEGFNRR